MRELPPALAAFGNYRQFIVYVTHPSRTRPGKTDKFPVDFRSGQIVDAHDPNIWTDHSTAIARAAQFGGTHGVGFVFTEADPFWFLDIDNCLQADNTWSSIAQQLCGALNGCAVEISQSGRGLHVFGVGRPPAHGCKNEPLGLEFYHARRFVALTGINAIGNAAADASALLPALVAHYFQPDAATGELMGWSDTPDPDWRGPTDDADLIRRALQSKSTASAFGGKASFADLWTGNVEALSKCYPDELRAYDCSSADAALAQHLAFWTGKDCARIERLMMASGLARDKYARDDYMQRTIIGAVSRQFEVLTDKAPEPAPSVAGTVVEGVRAKIVTGSTFLSTSEQIDMFAGCVYVQEAHKVFMPGGVMLKPDQFKVQFGGYTFTLDNANDKTTRDSWEAFTQNQSYRAPRATGTCFKPGETPGGLIEQGGQIFVNTYWPVNVARQVGDVSPAMDHLRRLIPDERDRLILICYMAACVQHQGCKFQWAPLIQGVEGNAKTLLSRYVANAVGRRYVHWPKASKLSKEFNAWMVGKVFYAVEDIYTPNARQEVIEELKPMITGGDGLEIEGKGVDQISADICGNFMFNSNHQDAIRKTQNDRRFCVFFSAQQSAADILRDGMAGDYFPNLYKWARQGGYAIMSEFLHTYPIPSEFNPALECGGLAHRAPTTTSTASAIQASVGGIEQELQEAIEQGLPGFCGGWVSSIQLDLMLENKGVARRVTHSKRREMLENMGYHYHPALIDGRVNNLVLPDNGKPRLFIHESAPARGIVGAAEAAKDYERANNHIRTPFFA